MMTQTFSTFALAILRAGALVCLVLLLPGLGFTQEVVTAKAADAARGSGGGSLPG
jgi:hypothetical protein